VSEGPGYIGYDPLWDSGEEGARARAAFTERFGPAKAGAKGDPERHERLRTAVVTRYRDLCAAELKRVKPAIARAEGISVSYVGALLAEARRLGELGPSVPGHVGETDPERSPRP